MRKLILILAALSAAAVVAVGCGDEDQAASGGAELAPAGAVMYAEATLKPEGDQKKALDAILAKFPGGGEAGDKLKELIEKGLRDSDAPITFKDDIEPWLGDSAAFFVSGMDGSGDFKSAAGLIATEDEDQAQAALEKSAEGEITRKTYKDVEYLMDEAEDTNAGMVHKGFVVLGTEAGVKAVIDASEGGSKLSDDEGYKNAIDGAAEDRLGLFYMDTPKLLEALEQTGGMALPDSFKKSFQEPLVATADVDEDGVVFEATVSEELAKTFGFLGQASDLMNELPADSWLAIAQTDSGSLVDYYVDLFGAVAGGRDTVERQFRAATGLDLQKDLIDWMGDFGVFVRGSTVQELDGALVIETKDEAASGRLLAALERIARSQSEAGIEIRPLSAPGGGDGFSASGAGVPKPVHAFQRDGRVVFAYGDAAAQDAIEADETLGDSADFSQARDSLGEYDVSVYVLMQPIFDLVDSTEAASDADWQEAKPYLEPLSALVAGLADEDDRVRSAMKLVVE